FHDGADFTGDDVKWTIEYIKKPETGSPNAPIIDPIDTVEVVDATHIRLHLKSPWPAIIDDLTTIFIYPKTATADSLATKPVGTGAFTWAEWVQGDHISLKKNPSYWQQGRPYLDELLFKPVKEYETRLAMLESGDIDVVFVPDLKDLAD